jgi:hypothetical protein
MNASPFLSLRGISKSFRPVKASNQIDVAGAGAAENELVALMFAEELREAPHFLSAASQAGARVINLLALPGFSGTVLAVLSGTIYLSLPDGEIFWIGPEGSPLHRRCILVSPVPKAAPGEICSWRFPRLTFGGGPFIDLRAAREWNPPGLGARESVSLEGFWVCFRRLLGVLSLLDFQDGMGRAIPLVRALAEGWPPPILPPTCIMGRARDLALELARACLDGDFPSVIRKGKEMIGWGPGLTPSGDDFLGGMFFAARSLHQVHPEDSRWNEDAVLELLGWAKIRTHPISHAILCDLALGHGPAPLHDLIGGLLEGRDLDPVMEAAMRLTAIGHSSGWDMLAGAVTGMLMIKKSVEQGAWNAGQGVFQNRATSNR